MTNRYELGNRIKKIRISLGIGQNELARRCMTTQQHISRIETGRQYPTLPMLTEISLSLKVRITDLLEDKYTSRQEEIARCIVNNLK